jgi:tRNA pseudouridine55 synthase
VGKATKRIDEFMATQKGYNGTIRLGATTPSYDAETQCDQFFPIAHLNSDFLQAKTPLFLGEIEQLPPVFSAIKVDGKPLYKAAHQGKGDEIKEKIQARLIQIFKFEIYNFTTNQLVIHATIEGVEEKAQAIALAEVDFDAQCSKGTYIRSLAYDFGKACDSGAYLSRLCRTSIGTFDLKNAWQLADLLSKIPV